MQSLGLSCCCFLGLGQPILPGSVQHPRRTEKRENRVTQFLRVDQPERPRGGEVKSKERSRGLPQRHGHSPESTGEGGARSPGAGPEQEEGKMEEDKMAAGGQAGERAGKLWGGRVRRGQRKEGRRDGGEKTGKMGRKGKLRKWTRKGQL